MKKSVSGMLAIFALLASVSSVPLFGEAKEKSRVTTASTSTLPPPRPTLRG